MDVYLKTIEDIKQNIAEVAKDYPLSKVTLFGSRARGDNKLDSDVDLLCYFKPGKVGLLMLSGLKIDLEEKMGLKVDVIHAPLVEGSIIEIDKEILLYEA